LDGSQVSTRARKRKIPIGVLFSGAGPYIEVAMEGTLGAMAGIEAINAHKSFPFELVPLRRDPEGIADRYAELAEEMVRKHGVQHIVGCTTSLSRKEVIPVLEKTGSVLWYPCVYEGYEANENVVYVGGCGNQHILPLLEYVLPRFGRNAILLGSNYVWGWETCRIAREVLDRSNGQVLGERHVPLGDTNVERIIEEIRRKKPDFILNSLIGPSSESFLLAYAELGQQDTDFCAEKRPVLSCNLTETEVAKLAPAVAGHLTVSSYFQSLATPENMVFLSSLPNESRSNGISALFALAYSSVMMIAAGLSRNGGALDTIVESVTGQDVASPLGTIRLQPDNNHIRVKAHIARATADGTYEILREGQDLIDPDPFMTRTSTVVQGAPARSHDGKNHLRLVT
jgi:ABC-type branched-subunit amino acid transport system substrate-binding protein